MKEIIQQIIEKSGVERGVEAHTPEGLILQGLAVLIKQARIEGKEVEEMNFADWLYRVGMEAEKLQDAPSLMEISVKSISRKNASEVAKCKALATLFWLALSGLSKRDPDHFCGYLMNCPSAKHIIRPGWFVEEE